VLLCNYKPTCSFSFTVMLPSAMSARRVELCPIAGYLLITSWTSPIFGQNATALSLATVTCDRAFFLGTA
jgi:hypothetical protein